MPVPAEKFGIRIAKEYLNFSAAHFLVYGPGAREKLHGHNYYVSMELLGSMGPTDDLYINFLDIKPVLRKICESLDHKVLVQAAHRDLVIEESEAQLRISISEKDYFVFPRGDVCLLPIRNTTAELLAEFILVKTLKVLSDSYANVLLEEASCSVEETRGQAAVCLKQFGGNMTLKAALECEGTNPRG